MQKDALKLSISFKIDYFCYFSLGENLVFLDSPKKIYNIKQREKWSYVLTTSNIR